MGIRIETDRLVLRQFETEDAQALHRIASEKHILKWMPDWESSIERKRELIRWFEEKYVLATRETARVMLAVTLKSDGALIGMVGIGNKKEVDNEIEIAYFTSEQFSGKGYITEAAKAMAEWTINTLKLDYLIAIVETENYPSQRVVEKCGFERIETRMIRNSGEEIEKPFYYYRLYKKYGSK